MTTQTSKHFALSLACLGLMLSASVSLAQGKLAVPPMFRHQPSSSSPAVVQKAQPGGSSYTYTLFDYPETFYTIGAALNVGATGKVEIVGCYGNPPLLGTESFRVYGSESKGTITEAYQGVNVPGSPPQCAFGVNDSGQIVGEYLDSASVYHGWELSGGTFTTIDVPFSGASGTGTNGISDSGEITGFWDGSGITLHGFTLISGTYTSFDYPGAVQTGPFGINNNGDIVGYYEFSDLVEHGFVLSGGTYTSIDPPGSVFTYAAGINDAGDIVGAYCTTSTCRDSFIGLQGFLLSKGVFTIFAIPGATGTGLQAINDKGLILGAYYDVAGFEHDFVAVP